MRECIPVLILKIEEIRLECLIKKVSLRHNDLVRLSEGSLGEILEYKIDLSQLEFPADSIEQHEEFYRKLRTLFRVLDNLTASKNLLLEIGEYLKSSNNSAFTSHVKAMFCHAVILYGACFLRGGAKRKAPLLYQDLVEEQFRAHKTIMDYRDKLFGHLDDNHSVRNDYLFCQFDVVSEKLIPTFVVRSGDKMALAGQVVNGDWLKHIDFLLDKVSKDAESLRAEYEIFLQTFEYEKK